MTEDEAFKELAAQNLAGFGWTITASDMPDKTTVDTVLSRLLDWWGTLTGDTKDIINASDITDGLWAKGWLTEWPALYTLAKGNPFERMSATFENILESIRNAESRAPEYAAQQTPTS